MDKRYLYLKNLIKIIGCFIAVMFLTGFYDPGIHYIRAIEKTVELGDRVSLDEVENISNYLTMGNFHLEDDIPTDDSGHTTEIGVYNYYIVDNNDERMYSRIAKTIASISVVDTTNPKLEVKSGSLKFNYNSKIKPKDLVNCYDLSGCTLSFKKSVNTKKVGTQTVTVVAMDKANNTSEIEVKITIKQVKYSSSLASSSNKHNNSINANLSASEKSNMRSELVNYAKMFEGNPYVWGGNSLTKGTDCSGFTKLIYAHFGYQIPRTVEGQSVSGISVSKSQLLPGDLVIFHRNGKVYHVALYIGNNRVIHAGTPKTGIVNQRLWSDPQFYRRIIY